MSAAPDKVRLRRSMLLGNREKPARPPVWRGALGLRLLVVDPRMSGGTGADLRTAGIRVLQCTRGTDALVHVGAFEPHALLLAPELPDLDAAEFVAAVRRVGDQPVLVGVGAEEAELAGPAFLAGATAAVSWPYAAADIVERLAATLPDQVPQDCLTFGPMKLDPLAHTVHVAGQEIEPLPLKEFQLLRLLLSHADQVVTPDEVRQALWGAATRQPSGNSIAVHVARLRSRLTPPLEVRTVRGVGYRLTLAPDQR
jgi:DNA-binding response OmpR family regulator